MLNVELDTINTNVLFMLPGCDSIFIVDMNLEDEGDVLCTMLTEDPEHEIQVKLQSNTRVIYYHLFEPPKRCRNKTWWSKRVRNYPGR
jgi:hypothetical protein